MSREDRLGGTNSLPPAWFTGYLLSYLTSLFWMGNPNRNKESASLLTRDPVPEAISLADATKWVDNGLTWEPSMKGVSTFTNGGGVPQRETVMAVVATTFPIQERRGGEEEEEMDASSGWRACFKIPVLEFGFVDWVNARDDGTNPETVQLGWTKNVAMQQAVLRVFIVARGNGVDLDSAVNQPFWESWMRWYINCKINLQTGSGRKSCRDSVANHRRMMCFEVSSILVDCCDWILFEYGDWRQLSGVHQTKMRATRTSHQNDEASTSAMTW